jgi:hypothetical protein
MGVRVFRWADSIGNLIKEIQEDVLLECVDDIKDEVFEVIKKRLMSTVIDGFPQWYQAHDCDPINWTAHAEAVAKSSDLSKREGSE